MSTTQYSIFAIVINFNSRVITQTNSNSGLVLYTYIIGGITIKYYYYTVIRSGDLLLFFLGGRGDKKMMAVTKMSVLCLSAYVYYT